MKACFFDDAGGGHHEGYLAGIVMAATRHGIYPLVATPQPPATLDESKGMWLQVPHIGLRQVRTGRKSVRSVIESCRTNSIEVFVNLYLDNSLWKVPNEVGQLRRRVHVLHHTAQYTYENRGGTARLRTIETRRRIAAWVRRGDAIVVHTKRAREVLSGFLPAESLVLLGYPVTVPAGSPTRMEPPSGGDTFELLFVGQARRQKGLPHLLAALRWLPGNVKVKVVGPQNPEVKARLEPTYDASRVTWIDEFVTNSQLNEHIRNASLVALPYEASFGRDGGASGVLLESLAHGVPLVTTTALEAQLPDQYGGAVVVEPGDPQALAGGITQALDNLPAMTTAARSVGPGFVLENHSFDTYVPGLVAER